MALKITRGTSEHYQYFKKEIIENNGAYIVSDKTSIVGLFSFVKEGNQASVTFTFVFNMDAILLALDTYLEDYQDVDCIVYKGNQNLARIGLKRDMEGYKYYRK